MTFNHLNHPYTYDPAYAKRVAYFSMEFALHQPLKIYSGGGQRVGFVKVVYFGVVFEYIQ